MREKYETSKLLCFICWLFCCCCCYYCRLVVVVVINVRIKRQRMTERDEKHRKKMNQMAKAAATFHLFADDFPFLSSQKNLLRTHNSLFFFCIHIIRVLLPLLLPSDSFSHSALLIAISFPFIQWTRSDPNYFLVDFCPTENNYCIHLDLRLTKYTFANQTENKWWRRRERKKNVSEFRFGFFFFSRFSYPPFFSNGIARGLSLIPSGWICHALVPCLLLLVFDWLLS